MCFRAHAGPLGGERGEGGSSSSSGSEAELKRVEAELEGVAAYIETLLKEVQALGAQAPPKGHSRKHAQELADLRAKELMMRFKEQQLREEKLLLLKRAERLAAGAWAPFVLAASPPSPLCLRPCHVYFKAAFIGDAPAAVVTGMTAADFSLLTCFQLECPEIARREWDACILFVR